MDAAVDIQIRAVMPELYMLLTRVKAIYALCGGDAADAPKLDRKTTSEFDYKKSMLISHLAQLDELITARETGGMDKESRDYIRVKNTIQQELTAVHGELEELVNSNKSELQRRGSKMTPEEVGARTGVLQAIMNEYQAVFKRAKGYAPETPGGGPGRMAIPVISKEQLALGTFAGAGTKIYREEMTAEHQLQMQQIRNETAQQDALLDEIASSLDSLKEMSERIGDELQLQEKMLADLEDKTDKTQEKVDDVNERVKRALKTMNEKSSRICLYLICFAILGALATVIYNMAKKK